ncbi:MAG: hypothetical protein Q7I99_09065 [Acholeplasmataceae bacterium]|nr:hypothetical protein [Acholeplasmataceae bacterium]
MKKLFFGFALMISGTIIIAGALIAGGTWAADRIHYDILDSAVSNGFVIVGSIIFLIGLVASGIETYKKEKLYK